MQDLKNKDFDLEITSDFKSILNYYLDSGMSYETAIFTTRMDFAKALRASGVNL